MKAIEIAAFVPYETIDPIRRIGDGYFLQGDRQVAAKPYVLLRKASKPARAPERRHWARPPPDLGGVRLVDVLEVHPRLHQGARTGRPTQ
ncbi:hypothetical protein DSC45_35150 [Streptomyces sp. YIM 130001]|nr:hypothetical protein DSC45_35150 [Streptomyces sp. YIM 130001]